MSTLTQKTQELPVGWRWVKLGEVCETTSGGTPSRGNTKYFGGDIPWIKSGELLDGVVTATEETLTQEGLHSSSAKVVPPGTLLIAMYGATVGRLGITRVSAATNQAVCAITPTDMVERDFLFYYLSAIRDDLVKASFGGAQPNISQTVIRDIHLPLPPLVEQRRLTCALREQMSAVERARTATQAQLEAIEALPAAFMRASLRQGQRQQHLLGDCLCEVRGGIGTTWSSFPVLGATRDGLAPAKEAVGKVPERYKLVDPVTVFYNPMRILLGSIAMVDEGDAPGITSPDYVVLKGKPKILDTRWFYYWFRSADGAHLIDSLSRGAVRERILFNRLAAGKIELPSFESQQKASEKMKQVKPIVEAITDELNIINGLPATLLRRAFNGEM
ncbi:MAG: restriction endonuclease subunit S [Armatimonadota bacterium]